MGKALKQSRAHGAFEEQAAATLARMRGALADLLEALPGHVTKAADLRKVLDLDNKLCWKVIKVVTASNPLSAGIHVPTPANMKSLLKAVGRKVPAARREAVEEAAADFERLVEEHAGDRTSFDSMISGFGRNRGGSINITHKRAAFRANSHLYGIQAGTQLNCCLLHPGTKPDMLDIATLRGCIDLRRMRPDATWIVAEARTADSDGVVRHVPKRVPLDASQETTHGLAPMPKFCTKPLPKFRNVEGSGGFVLGELAGNGVGNTSSVTCITGDVVQNVASVFQDEHNRYGELVAGVHTPCKVLIHDVLIRRGMFGPIAPQVLVQDDYWRKVSISSAVLMPDAVALAAPEVVSRLGQGTSVLPTPEVPRYLDMVDFVAERLGWDLEEFEVFRCRVEFPVVHSAIIIRFDLPKAKPR